MPDQADPGRRRSLGQHYTEGNPFTHPAFRAWAERANLPEATVLEPFAGANGLVERLREVSLCGESVSYDVEPGAEGVGRRDTLESFPEGHAVCVSNPPWLARNSATRRGIPFPESRHDDLYKIALERCLAHCGRVALIVPEAYIRTGLFHGRMTDFVSLTSRMFADTDSPAGLALFDPDPSPGVAVWSGEERVGTLEEMQGLQPAPVEGGPDVAFNAPDGNIGLFCVDGTTRDSIRFCETDELGDYIVKGTNRCITALKVDARVAVDALNERLADYRERTRDVLLAPFMGLRADGRYRRRLDWKTAKGIVHAEAITSSGGFGLFA